MNVYSCQHKSGNLYEKSGYKQGYKYLGVCTAEPDPINPTPICYIVNQALPFHLGSDNSTKMKRQRELIYTDNNANDDYLACESTVLKVRIIILEIIDDSFGLYLWPSSFVLAQYIWHLRHSHVQYQRILELGAGVALPGFLAAKLGAKEVDTIAINSRSLET